MENEAFISYSFSQNIRNILNENLNYVKPDIENEYINILNYYLNNKFINSYKNTLNDETEKIINLINDYRNTLMIEMGDLFVLESENILEEINLQINNTLDSINQYNSILNKFKIPEELVKYLNTFGGNNIKPIYDEFKKRLDEISNNQIILNFEKNSNNFENLFNKDEFIKISNSTLLNLKENYIDNILNYTNNYYSNYFENYEKETYKETTDINDKHLDDTFPKLLKNIDNIKVFIQTLKEFNDYDKNIIKYINNINIAYKESKKLIDEYNDEDNYIKFNDKLLYLKDKSLDYYNKVNESYYNIRQYLNKSIQDINENINKCINITYEALIKEYKKMVEEEKPLNQEFSKNDDSEFSKLYRYKIEDTTYYVHTTLKNIEQYSKFIMNLLFENNDYKNPKIVASIINKNIPRNMILDIYTLYGNCAKKGIIIDANINEANYQMNLNFDTKSTHINATTITNFEKYEYNTEVYEYEDTDEVICFTIAYIEFCIPAQCNDKKSLSNEKVIYDKKQSKETYFIKY